MDATPLRVKTTWQNLAKCQVEKGPYDDFWDDADEIQCDREKCGVQGGF
jgi:hypothetical protein